MFNIKFELRQRFAGSLTRQRDDIACQNIGMTVTLSYLLNHTVSTTKTTTRMNLLIVRNPCLLLYLIEF